MVQPTDHPLRRTPTLTTIKYIMILNIVVLLFILLLKPSSSADFLYSTSPNVLEVETLPLDHSPYMTLDRPSLVIFYAPWCPHCKHYKSTYEEIGERLSNTERLSSVNQLHPQVRAVPALAVSCTEHSGYCSEMEVHGYPTLKYWDELGWQEIKERKVDAVEAKVSRWMMGG